MELKENDYAFCGDIEQRKQLLDDIVRYTDIIVDDALYHDIMEPNDFEMYPNIQYEGIMTGVTLIGETMGYSQQLTLSDFRVKVGLPTQYGGLRQHKFL